MADPNPDTPFVDLSSPPRSNEQPIAGDANVRGWDFQSDPQVPAADEWWRATQYAQHLTDMANGHARIVAMLAGNREAAESLQRKTLALTRAAPPHVDMP